MVMSLWPHFWPTLLYDVIYQTGASLHNSMITLPEADRAMATGNTQKKVGEVRSEVCLLIYESRQTDKRSGVVANIYLAERMASAEREPITGVWGEAEKVLRFGHAMETATLPYNSQYFGN